MTGYQDVAGATWQVNNLANSAPVNESVTSASSNVGQFRTITTVYSDADGALDLSRVWLQVQNTTGWQSLYAKYDSLTNLLSLYNDTGTALVGSFAPGSAHTLSNSLGTLDCANTTVSLSGNTLTVNWSIALKATMSGSNKFMLQSVDKANAMTGYQSILGATWDILA